MKKYLFLTFCAIVSFAASAQNARIVNGVVFDENDTPLAGVELSAIGVPQPVVTGVDGTFTLSASPYASHIEARCEGYLSARAEIDGSYIIFRMKVDKKYAERIAAAEAARLDAERAKAKAEEDARIAAEKKAAAEAEAKRKAEEAARVAAEKEAAAKAKAEEEARIAAEKKAAAEAEAKRKAEEAARVAAERAAAKEKRQNLNSEYNKKYRNKGIINTLEISYSYPLYQGDVVYENFGYRNYSTLHPAEVVYMLGYRFCNWVSLSAGAGFAYDFVDLRNYGDSFYNKYENTSKYSNWNIPVFLNVRTYLSRGKCQPMLSVSGGIYAPHLEMLLDFGLGCNIRLGKRVNMYFMASFKTVPCGRFIEPYWSGEDGYYYENSTAWAPSFKIGFTL